MMLPWPLDRRAFLKQLSAATAGCAALPLATEAQGNTVWRRAPCQLCGVGCGLLVGIQNGRAVAVKGDPDSPVNRGLLCVKGYHSVQALYGRDRITRAQIRQGSTLVDASLGDALNLVAQKLRESVATHGKDSIAIMGSGEWTLTDHYAATRLFERGLGTGNITSDADLALASAQAGFEASFGMGDAVGGYDDIEQADVFVIWNQNLAETDPVLFSRLLERRRSNPGVKIIELATRTTRTSYATDRSLLYAPQTELAMANAIAQEILARGWQDRNFIERHVAYRKGRTGLEHGLTGDRMADRVSDTNHAGYVKFLAAYTPERAQQISGLPADDLRWLASLYGDRARKVMSVWGSNVNRHPRGTWLNNLIVNLHLLVGKIAAPGNGPLALANQPLSAIAQHDTGDSRRRPGVVSVVRRLESGAVRFLWLQGGNPLNDLPNLKRYRKAFNAEDRFVVVSAAYPNATTAAADVVLPAALWIERAGESVNSERRIAQFERMLTPPGTALSYSAQLIEVARRIGQDNLLPAATANDSVWEELRRSLSQPARSLPALAELRAGPGVRWPFVNGRETRQRYNADHDPAADRTYGGFDFYGHADHRAWIWLRPHEPPAEAPDREYPFWLTTGEVLEHSGSGSLTRRIPVLHGAVPRAYVEINRWDADRLGIRNGETVQLVSRRGVLRIEARIDYRAQPVSGHVFVPSFDEQLAVNLLTLDASCPLSGQPVGSCAVRVERLSERGAR